MCPWEKAKCVLEVIRSGAVKHPFQGACRREGIDEPWSVGKIPRGCCSSTYCSYKDRRKGGESLAFLVQ